LGNCVRQRRPVSKLSAMTKNRNFFKWPQLLYFKPESAQIWTDYPRFISAKFGWDWLSSFRGQFFFKFHPPFFLICIIGQNRQKFKVHKKSRSILSQKVPKFKLYKHNELFNRYYGIFNELWTFAYFDRLCKLDRVLC
jgi:hypothetical protein